MTNTSLNNLLSRLCLFKTVEKKKSIILSTLILFCNLISFGQYRVTAIVIDEENNPEEYATFRIYAVPDTTHQILGNVRSEEHTSELQSP